LSSIGSSRLTSFTLSSNSSFSSFISSGTEVCFSSCSKFSSFISVVGISLEEISSVGDISSFGSSNIPFSFLLTAVKLIVFFFSVPFFKFSNLSLFCSV